MKNTKKAGTLYLIPAPLGEHGDDFLPENVKSITYGLKHFIVEKEKTARRVLKSIGYPYPLDSVDLYELNARTSVEKMLAYINLLTAGFSVGLMSEAGAPCIADPGEQFVNLAHQCGIKVVPLVGPSAIMLALMASGVGANNFAFRGYLPVKPQERRKRIVELERLSRKHDEAQIFIETPYRNAQLFDEILKACLDDTLLCVAREITLPGELILTMPVSKWRKHKVSLHKRPTVFILCAK
ncbi:MAG TPA: SAM-dependent methyltransferase [Chitinophagales bacterium]|nr:SAM-dependent methyltransferase [Chitinophagales bacterium]